MIQDILCTSLRKIQYKKWYVVKESKNTDLGDAYWEFLTGLGTNLMKIQDKQQLRIAKSSCKGNENLKLRLRL